MIRIGSGIQSLFLILVVILASFRCRRLKARRIAQTHFVLTEVLELGQRFVGEPM